MEKQLNVLLESEEKARLERADKKYKIERDRFFDDNNDAETYDLDEYAERIQERKKKFKTDVESKVKSIQQRDVKRKAMTDGEKEKDDMVYVLDRIRDKANIHRVVSRQSYRELEGLKQSEILRKYAEVKCAWIDMSLKRVEIAAKLEILKQNTDNRDRDLALSKKGLTDLKKNHLDTVKSMQKEIERLKMQVFSLGSHSGNQRGKKRDFGFAFAKDVLIHPSQEVNPKEEVEKEEVEN